MKSFFIWKLFSKDHPLRKGFKNLKIILYSYFMCPFKNLSLAFQFFQFNKSQGRFSHLEFPLCFYEIPIESYLIDRTFGNYLTPSYYRCAYQNIERCLTALKGATTSGEKFNIQFILSFYKEKMENIFSFQDPYRSLYYFFFMRVFYRRRHYEELKLMRTLLPWMESIIAGEDFEKADPEWKKIIDLNQITPYLIFQWYDYLENNFFWRPSLYDHIPGTQVIEWKRYITRKIYEGMRKDFDLDQPTKKLKNFVNLMEWENYFKRSTSKLKKIIQWIIIIFLLLILAA